VPAWVLAFVTAVGLALAGTPVLRRLAVAIGFVDHPARHKSHRQPVPYLGGIAIITSVLVAQLFEGGLRPRVALLLTGAAGLGAMGLLDDDRTIDPRFRFAAELAAAGLAVGVGIRIHASGIPLVDILLTILWIVGVTNAINLLDNMDALAAGVCLVAALSVFALAILGRQPVIATLGAAVAGACLGFLAFNRPPASIFMGDAGSLFLGFVLAILTVNVSPALFPPVSFLVPLLILALPVLDTTVVTLARLRHGRPVSQGGRDHLSHRLVRRGMRPRSAVALLVAFEAVLGTLAVLSGRRVVPVWLTLVVAIGLLGALALAARVKIYPEDAVGYPRALRRAVIGILVAMPVFAAPAVIALFNASGPARAGARAAELGIGALQAGDAKAGAAHFHEAKDQLDKAETHLDRPFVLLGLAIPGLSSNLQASRTVVSIANQLSDAGLRLAEASDAGPVDVTGEIPLDRLRRLTPELERADAVVKSARRRLDSIEQPFLVPAVAEAVDDLNARLASRAAPVELASRTAQLLPTLLGADGPRHYFLAFQNSAELRGNGGFIGNWGEIIGEGGRLRLDRFGRLAELNEAGTRPLTATSVDADFVSRWRNFNPTQYWEQVNVSPDFPTTAGLIAELYPQSGGREIDGVIAVDPTGLAAMLQLTGPVYLPQWPVPVTAANVVDIVLRDAYVAFPQDDRVTFLGDLTKQVAEAFTRADLSRPAALASSLGSAAGNGHMVVWMSRPEEQTLMTDLGVTGAVPRLKGDSLLVVNQNLAANKVDSFFHRRIRYDVAIAPGGSGSQSATLTGRAEVTLSNDAPASGLPAQVIGPYDERFQPGENRTYVSVYTPFAAVGAALDGVPLDMDSEKELGRYAQSTEISIPAMSSRTLTLDLAGRVSLTEDGWYRLDVQHQTSLVPDDVEVNIEVPRGWRISEVKGLDPVGERRATGRMELERAHTILVRVVRTGWAGVWERLTDRS